MMDGMKTHSMSPPTYLPTQPNQDEEYNVIMLEVERRKGQDDGNPWVRYPINHIPPHHHMKLGEFEKMMEGDGRDAVMV